MCKTHCLEASAQAKLPLFFVLRTMATKARRGKSPAQDLVRQMRADGLADELHGLRGPPGHRTRVRHVELRRGCNSDGNGSFELLEVKDNSCKLGPYLDFAVSGHWNISSLECKPIFESKRMLHRQFLKLSSPFIGQLKTFAVQQSCELGAIT